MLSLLPSIEILAPADTAAVAEAVRKAVKKERAVYPRGGGAHWNYGLPPTQPGVVLSLEKMNRLVDRAAEDMTVTVEAGMTFAELSRILTTKNQRLPIDVREPEKATLGGLVAVNRAGPRQYGYGTIRDYLLGFTAVDGEGTIFHGGGRVVKNAAGYNMNRLMAGSMGTLGLLTQLTFMVRPLPEKSAVTSCEVPDLETAEELLAGLNKSQVRPAAIELVGWVKRSDDPPMNLDGESGGAALRLTHPTLLVVLLEGTISEVTWMLDTLHAEWQATGVQPSKSAIDLESLAIDADVQIAVRPSQVVQFMAAIKEKYPDCSIQSHAGNGIVLVESSWGRAEGASYYRQLRELGESFDGRTTVLHCPEDVELSREDIWGPPPAGFNVMRALKERFDPHNVLNPGRFIFE